MGQSTDGILAFGIDFGDDFDTEPFQDTDGDFDFDDFIATEAGVGFPVGDVVESDAERDVRWAAAKIAVAACPIEIVEHCSGGYPMYIIAVRGTKIRATRGDATVVSQSMMAVSHEKMSAAKKWCEAHSIEWSQPHWLLCSMWD